MREVGFLEKAFRAELTFKHEEEGRIRHCELRIGDSMVMLGQSRTGDGTPCSIYLYVRDCDACIAARSPRARSRRWSPPTSLRRPQRCVVDPQGLTWWIGMRIKDVP